MMFSLRTFKKEEDGTILVFAALCLAMIIGFAALTFDLGRMASTQTDLQSYVDHVALAAAGELDGNPDAITRATNAANAMIADKQFFADGDKTLDSAADFDLLFLKALPSPDDDPEDNDPVDHADFRTTIPAEAVMVEVTATPRTVFIPFARALASLVGAATPNEEVSAKAIAGYTSYACDVTPLMFCIPRGWTSNANKGSTIQLRTGGNSSAWGPGNFGFLDPEDIGINPNGPCVDSSGKVLTGSKLYICLIAANGNLTKCVAQRGVDTEPGQRNGIGSAIYNSRFDMFNATMKSFKDDAAYAPGPQVISGWENTGGSCLGNNPTRSTDTMPFPPDDCFETDSCASVVPNGAGRFGDGDWDEGKSDYLALNYGTGLDPENNPLEEHPSIENGTILMPAGTTRYQMYLDEIEKFKNETNILENRSETGRAQCSKQPSSDPDRRTLIAAAINCEDNPVSGRAEDVPVQEFVKVFLIQPLEESTGSDFDIYVEVVEQVGGSGTSTEEGIFRDVVRLYR